MTDPDALVDASGDEADLNRLTDAVTDTNEQFDPDTSTFETVTIGAYASPVTEEELSRLEGRVDTADLKITVKSGVDISATRSLRADRVRYPSGSGTIYQVVAVETQTHPLTGLQKQTAFLEQLPGRVELADV
jgi:hypothetical protein